MMDEVVSCVQYHDRVIRFGRLCLSAAGFGAIDSPWEACCSTDWRVRCNLRTSAGKRASIRMSSAICIPKDES
jgi:hypothetical protein